MPTGARPDVDESTGLVSAASRAGRPVLDEWEAKRLLAAYGVPVPAGGLAHDAAEAIELAGSLGGPVALKAVGTHIRHKTEARLVTVGLRTPADVECAYRGIVERAGDDLEAVLVEESVAGTREFMVGMKRDAAFGPVLMFGLGGVMTEVYHDVALAISPVDERDVAELLDLIQARQLLGEFRGMPAVDRSGLVDVVLAVARVAADHPSIAEIDVNPVLICGSDPVAVDALVILGPEPPPAALGERVPPDLDAVIRPRSVAVVGASDDVTRWGGSALQNIIAGRFCGAIFPVNPRGGEYFGLPVCAGVEDLPEPVDLALLAVGAAQLGDVVAQCGRRGVRAAVAIAAGFSETGAEGVAAERALAAAAAAAGVTLIGPNCMGLVANASSLHATGFISLHPSPGTVSIVSQSGNLGTQLVTLIDRRGAGVRAFVGVGNEAQVTAVDVLEYLRDDDGTACVLMYLEGVDDGRRLLDVARRTSAVKPVVVLRGGTTEQGGRAAASHTGAMAGSAAVFSAAARQGGLVQCATVPEALDLTLALANLPLPRGRRVAVVTNGGGAGVLAADEVARHNLELAELPPELLAEIDAILPPFWSRRNPLDMVASAGGDVASRVLEAVVRCPSIDAVMVLSVLGVPNTGDHERAGSASGDYDDFSLWEAAFLQTAADLMAETGKPIVNVPDLPIRRAVAGRGAPYDPVVVPSPEAAAFVLDHMARYAEWRARHATGDVHPDQKDRS